MEFQKDVKEKLLAVTLALGAGSLMTQDDQAFSELQAPTDFNSPLDGESASNENIPQEQEGLAIEGLEFPRPGAPSALQPDGPTTPAPGGPSTPGPRGPSTLQPNGPSTIAPRGPSSIPPDGPTTPAPGGPTTPGPRGPTTPQPNGPSTSVRGK